MNNGFIKYNELTYFYMIFCRKKTHHKGRSIKIFYENIIVILVPFPKVLATDILYPYNKQICLTIDNPKPVPEDSFDLALSTR